MSRTTTSPRRSSPRVTSIRGRTPRPSAPGRGTRGQRVAASIVVIGLVGAIALFSSGLLGHGADHEASGDRIPATDDRGQDDLGAEARPFGARHRLDPSGGVGGSAGRGGVRGRRRVDHRAEPREGRFPHGRDAHALRHRRLPVRGRVRVGRRARRHDVVHGLPGRVHRPHPARRHGERVRSVDQRIRDHRHRRGRRRRHVGHRREARDPPAHRTGRLHHPAPVPAPAGSPTTGPQPRDIARGADGTMWFTDPGTGSVGSVSPGAQPVITEHLISRSALPRSIAARSRRLGLGHEPSGAGAHRPLHRVGDTRPGAGGGRRAERPPRGPRRHHLGVGGGLIPAARPRRRLHDREGQAARGRQATRTGSRARPTAPSGPPPATRT